MQSEIRDMKEEQSRHGVVLNDVHVMFQQLIIHFLLPSEDLCEVSPSYLY